MTTGNEGFDMDGGHDIAHERIMKECGMWGDPCKPIFVPEDDSDIARWPALEQHAAEWMEDAKRIAVAGYRQVLEDGPDVCDSESGSDDSDYGEMWSYADMYTPDMLSPDGKPKTGGRQQLSAAQANAMRATAKLAVSQPTVSTEFTSSQATTRPSTPLNIVEGTPKEAAEDQKRPFASA
jgi:hypothetical protein